MKNKRVISVVTSVLAVFAAFLFFTLIAGSGGVPGEPVAAAEGRQFAVMHIYMPEIEGPYSHPALPPSGIKVIDVDCSVVAPANSGEPNDPWGSRPEFSQISITKEFDKTSPDLAYYCATGQRFGQIFIRLLPAGDPPTEPAYYEIVLKDAIVSELKDRIVYREKMVDGTYAHLQQVSLKFRQITWTDLNSGKTQTWNLYDNQGL